MKKNTYILLIVFLFVGLASCNQNYQNVTNKVENYEQMDYILTENNSLKIDVDEIFKNSNIKISKYKITCSNPDLVKIRKNIIRPLATGIASLSISLFENSTSTEYVTSFAKVYSIIEKDMTVIETKEQLIALQNVRTGNYLLKQDIDLIGVDWEPIGNFPANNEFRGMFVNLDNYKIKNLTVTSSDNVFHGPYGGCNVGLFGSTKSSFLYGIKLENVNLNGGDFISEYSGSETGGIVAASLSDTIMNCKVEGKLVSTWSTGGIVGSSSWSKIINCSFKGEIIDTANSTSTQNGSGGIAGYCGGGKIINCDIDAVLSSRSHAGFVSGWCETYGGKFNNNSYVGQIITGQGESDSFGKYIERGGFN